jgi:hypothetical protein
MVFFDWWGSLRIYFLFFTMNNAIFLCRSYYSYPRF